MKKVKLLLFLLIGIFVLSINNSVLAASSNDEIVAYMECTYKDTNQFSDKISGNYYYSKDGYNYLTFAYTQISVGERYLAPRVFVKYSNSNNWLDLAYRARVFAPNITEGAGNNISNTFVKIIEDNDLSCPKYFVFQKGEGSGNPYFTNKKTEYCGPNLENCGLITELDNAKLKKIIPEERIWVRPNSGYDNSEKEKQKYDCASASVKLFVDSNDGNKLKAEISYPTFSSFYKETVGQPKTLNIDIIDDGSGGIAFEYVYDIIMNNTMGPHAFRAYKDREKFWFNSKGETTGFLGLGGVDSCYDVDSVKLNLEYTCDTGETYMSLESNYKDSALLAINDYNDLTSELVEGSGNTFVAKDFSNYTDKKALLDLLSPEGGNADFYSTLSTAEYYINKHSELLDTAREDKQLCYSTSLYFSQEVSDLKEDYNNLQARNAAVNQAVENIKKRLTELGASEEEKSDADKLLDALDKLDKAVENGISVLKKTSFIAGDVKLDFESGCGIITPKLESWLKQLLDIIKISALVLTLILGMVDFFRGVASGSADTMKKVWTSFSRRLIVVAILFLLPVILEFVLGLININGLNSSNPLCGIK